MSMSVLTMFVVVVRRAGPRGRERAGRVAGQHSVATTRQRRSVPHGSASHSTQPLRFASLSNTLHRQQLSTARGRY